ncbi:hypothetical protein [Spirosoma rhododendri]|uniref:Uncharacterized protein n=1 Tax=Spirosoma rhododendri TaxID=2728024 RepID=A0A7L5DN38_9BACT|nr:hypothetical protein [Spirosoma rhododendri]QJD79869.1 hypothetical protein HH216_16690 [Spirosoma rhododendri]
MATLSHTSAYTSTPTNKWLARYQKFVTDGEFNRTGWAATALAVQGCILSPTLLLTMAYLGGGDWQFLTGMLCFLLVLIPILAAMPLKTLVPAFVLSFVIQAAIILLNIL